jgi:hypothetical protein
MAGLQAECRACGAQAPEPRSPEAREWEILQVATADDDPEAVQKEGQVGTLVCPQCSAKERLRTLADHQRYRERQRRMMGNTENLDEDIAFVGSEARVRGALSQEGLDQWAEENRADVLQLCTDLVQGLARMVNGEVLRELFVPALAEATRLFEIELRCGLHSQPIRVSTAEQHDFLVSTADHRVQFRNRDHSGETAARLYADEARELAEALTTAVGWLTEEAEAAQAGRRSSSPARSAARPATSRSMTS